MPWLETVTMDQRLQFIHDALRDRFTMAARCARYGISRRVGYKWLARYADEGRRGLQDRRRAPPTVRTRSTMTRRRCGATCVVRIRRCKQLRGLSYRGHRPRATTGTH